MFFERQTKVFNNLEYLMTFNDYIPIILGEKMNANKKQLLTIFLIIFIDLLGFGLIIPIVPFYLQ